MKRNDQYPPVVAGMHDAELADFSEWLHECCGMDLDELSPERMEDAAYRWYDYETEYGIG